LIPRINKNGYLPKGIHKATPEEIKMVFGTGSARRTDLLEGFVDLIKLIRKFKDKIKMFLIDGSFIASHDSPRDIDCILVVTNDFDFNSPSARLLQKAKTLFHAHLFVCLEIDKNKYESMIKFFSMDRNQKEKGIVEVIL
jgi:hypothetical protein